VFEVRTAVEQACASFHAVAHEKGLALDCHVHPDVPRELVGDPARLQQLLQQLLSHAIRYTDQGRVLLELQRLEARADGTLLRCQVSDTGAARDAAIQMFGPMRQADGAAGLGLSVARQLAAMMGGQLVLESDPTQGNRFVFTAPFRHALPSGGASAQERAAAQAAFPALCACGVDMAGALQRAQGNIVQLRKALGQFHQGQAALHVTIADALAQGERPRAQRLAHTLAGLSAQLGMEELRQDAAAVLNALRSGGAASDELARLAPRLDQVLQAVHADLRPSGASGESGEQAA